MAIGRLIVTIRLIAVYKWCMMLATARGLIAIYKSLPLADRMFTIYYDYHDKNKA